MFHYGASQCAFSYYGENSLFIEAVKSVLLNIKGDMYEVCMCTRLLGYKNHILYPTSVLYGYIYTLGSKHIVMIFSYKRFKL